MRKIKKLILIATLLFSASAAALDIDSSCRAESGRVWIEGTVTNTKSNPVSGVRIQLIWRDSLGQSIEHDFVYAGGASGVLYPGDSAEFRSSSTAPNISKCLVNILSYNGG